MGLADQVCRRICPRSSSIPILLTTEASPSAWTVDAAPTVAWAYRSRIGKVPLVNVAAFKPGDNLNKWMESIWTTVLLYQGSAALQHWVHEVNYLGSGLQPPPSVLHTAVHRFNA